MRFVDLDCGCPLCANILSDENSPPNLTVSGAGNEAVNGRYVAQGKIDGAINYTKDCSDANPKIFLCCAPSVPAFWLISTADVNHYIAFRSDKSEIFPPRQGWRQLDPGHAPPPTLTYNCHHEDYCSSDSCIKDKTICKTCSEGTATAKISEIVRSKKYASRLQELGNFWTKLEAVECKSDQDKACAAFLRFVISNPCRVLQAKRTVNEVLALCKRKERYSMLELAVWRSVCKMQVPKDVSDYYACVEWHCEGWKKLKSDMRHSSSIHVIMMSVISYIEHMPA